MNNYKIRTQDMLGVILIWISTYFVARIPAIASFSEIFMFVGIITFLIIRKGMFSFKITLKELGLIALVYILYLITNDVINSFIKVPVSENQSVLVQLITNKQTALLIIFYAVIIAPIIEEIVFRGVFLELLLRKINKYIALIISAFLFAFPHMILGIMSYGLKGINYLAMLPYVIMGLAFGIVYIYSKKLSTSIWLHILNNSLAVLAIFITL